MRSLVKRKPECECDLQRIGTFKIDPKISLKRSLPESIVNIVQRLKVLIVASLNARTWLVVVHLVLIRGSIGYGPEIKHVPIAPRLGLPLNRDNSKLMLPLSR